MPRIPRLGRRDALKIGHRTDTQPPAGPSATTAPEADGVGGMPGAPGAQVVGQPAQAPVAPAPPDGAAAQDFTEVPVAESTAELSATPGVDAPAGQDPAAAMAPDRGFGARGRMRRRMRFLRGARELAFRDLGGLVFNLHRFGRRRDDLVIAKLDTLSRIDSELRALQTALDERQMTTVLHEPGIVACPRCAAIHGSDARFCPHCGLAIGRGVERPMAVAAGVGATAGPGARVATDDARPAVNDVSGPGAPEPPGQSQPMRVPTPPPAVGAAPGAGTGAPMGVAPGASTAPATPLGASEHAPSAAASSGSEDPVGPEQPTRVLPVAAPGVQSGNGEVAEDSAKAPPGEAPTSAFDTAAAGRASDGESSSA